MTRKAVEKFLTPNGYGESLQCELAGPNRLGSALLGELSSYVRPFWNKMYLRKVSSSDKFKSCHFNAQSISDAR